MDGSDRAEAVAEAFGALANPLRVQILLALAETRQPNWDHRGLSYGDLRTAVGVEDGGRFNYHLDELRGEFVVGEDGHYWLTSTGVRVVDDVFAGVYGGSHDPREAELDDECDRCGTALTAHVVDGLVSVRCAEHGVVFDMPLGSPRAAEERPIEDVVAWADRRGRWYHVAVAWDVCPHCGGRFGEGAFRMIEDPTDAPGPRGAGVLVDMECDRCAIAFEWPVVAYATVAPAAVAFFVDHGAERLTQPAIDRTIDDVDVELVGDCARVTLAADDERLTVDLDSSLDVTDVSRETVGD